MKKLLKKLLKNTKFREEFVKKDLAFEIGQMVSEARIVQGITQKRLAEKIGSKQSSIARLENGGSLPSLITLEKIAKELNVTFNIMI